MKRVFFQKKSQAFILVIGCGLLISSVVIQAIQGNTGADFSRLRDHFFANGSSANDPLFADWKGLVDKNHGQPIPSSLKLVNDFINKEIKYDSDLQVWNKNDYWATPMQSLGIQRGDCEDYSIAKYFTLAATGIPEDKLRLMYVVATVNHQYNQAHMVLAYYQTPNAEPLVLDNLNKEILPASARDDLRPIFSLARRDNASSANMEANDAQARLREASRQTSISVWDGLVKRAQSEGFE